MTSSWPAECVHSSSVPSTWSTTSGILAASIQTLRWPLGGAGLFLWAVELRLEHPISGQPVQVEIPEPAKFESHRLREDRRWARLREADKI